MNLYIRPPPFGATKQAIRNIIINQKKKEMNKRFAIAILPKEKQQGRVKYGLKIEKLSALGNVYGLTEEELKELRGLIDEALKK